MKLALVPTLGVLALVSSAANAQEVAKGLFLDGWADNIFTYTTQPKLPATGGTTLPTQATDLADFSASAKIKLSWKPTDKITGFVGVKFQNKNAGTADGQAYLQESYAKVGVTDELTWTMGKYIAHMGYVSAEPTGLYRINGSTIGALLYTNDVIGTSLAWSPAGSPFSGSVHIVNGFYTGKDTYNDTSVDAGATAVGRRSDLGLGIDLIYALPDSKGFINLEAAWDPSSSTPVAGKLPSDVLGLGINGEYSPIEKWKIGSEFMLKTSKNASFDDSGNPDNKQDAGFLLMVNYVLPTTTPASATLMYQQLNNDFGSKTVHTPVVHEFSAAILTNPFGSDKLGINGEIAYAKVDTNPDGVAANGQTVLSLEALVIIP